MVKLRVKNFGPINEGIKDNGFIEIAKTTLFIGNQATGKSSIAKLFSTISWLEKSLYRGDTKSSYLLGYNRFVKTYCSYQGIEDYFRDDTEIKYIGYYYTFIYKNKSLYIEEKKENKDYLPPKLMYVPAERNFLSIVENPGKVKYLPLPLYTFLDEFERSKSELNQSIDLPINNVKFEYQRQNKISYIKGENYKLKLHLSSSGIQSLLPVFLVSNNLAHSINRAEDASIKKISIEQQERLKKEIDQILENSNITSDIRSLLLERLSSRYKNLCFINIVEEIEQNLFPTSQRNLVNELLKYNNMTQGNKLLLTTHSPYIINYLTLAIKGYEILNKIQKLENKHIYIERLSKVVPKQSCINAEAVRIYELTDDGTIRLLPNYEGLPSDNNYLNNFLSETNHLFDELLDIEDEIL